MTYPRFAWLSAVCAPILLVASSAQAQPEPSPTEPPAPTDAAASPDAPASASPPAPAPAPPTVPDPVPAPPTEVSPFTARLYGFVEEQLSATFREPNGEVTETGRAVRAPTEFDMALPAFHIMAQGSLYSRYRFYFNLAANAGDDIDEPTHDAAIGIRNAWMEVSLFGDYLNLRAGKLYRRFGLYNEILDTVPSFIGVELPVVFGISRPMLTRTTNAMLHGKASFGASTIAYAATAGKDEMSTNDDVIAPGFDLNYDYDATFLIGTSYYTTAGTVVPHVGLNQGPAAGGIAPWLAQDRYQVFGGYSRLTVGNFLLHGEAWFSPHVSTRDPDKVVTLAGTAADFSDANRARMGVAGPNASPADVIKDAKYMYSTVNVRAAYTFALGRSADPIELTPFVNFEYIRNQESISDEENGGDGEAGHSARGIAIHNRVGCVIRPVPPVAIKTEATYAMYAFSGGFVGNPELWLSLSMQWELVHR